MRLIDADALIARCGSWYTEEGPEEGFIGILKNIVDMMPTIEPERKNWESLKDQIYMVKRNLKSENSDYLTGYLCALSAVEGIIAEVEDETD